MILNTRPQHQSQSLTVMLRARNKAVFDFPVFDIEPVLIKADQLKATNTLVFLSANAVHYFFDQVKKEHYKDAIIIAIGPATKNALHKLGFLNVVTPVIFSSEGLLALPELQQPRDVSITIVSGENPTPLLQDTLKKRGAIIQAVHCYRRVTIAYDMKTQFTVLQSKAIDTIICTSMESLQALIRLFDRYDQRAWLLSKTLCVISDKMRQAAIETGFVSVRVADNATDEAISKVVGRPG